MHTHLDTQDVAKTVRLPSSQYQALKEVAAAEQRTLSGQLRVAVQEHLDRRTTQDTA